MFDFDCNCLKFVESDSVGETMWMHYLYLFVNFVTFTFLVCVLERLESVKGRKHISEYKEEKRLKRIRKAEEKKEKIRLAAERRRGARQALPRVLLDQHARRLHARWGLRLDAPVRPDGRRGRRARLTHRRREELAQADSAAAVFEAKAIKGRGLADAAVLQARYRALNQNKEISMQFVLGWSMEEFSESLNKIASGEINASALITKQITLDQVSETFKELSSPNADAKVLVKPWM